MADKKEEKDRYIMIVIILMLACVGVGFAVGYHTGAFDGYHLALKELHVIPASFHLGVP